MFLLLLPSTAPTSSCWLVDLHRAWGQAEGIIKYELPRYGSARGGGGANGRETDVMVVSLEFIIIFL